MISVLTEDGKIAEIIELNGSVNPRSSEYAGLAFSKEGRKKVVDDLDAAGLVEEIEDRKIELGHSDRSKTPIEPFLSDQWFVKMSDLTEEEAARVQTSFLKRRIEDARSGKPSSGSKVAADAAASSSAGARSSTAARAASEPPSPEGEAGAHLPGLAQIAMEAVQDKRVTFHPQRYAKTYLDWLGEKRDWCISRQLWWGHRIPVWSSILSNDVGGETEDLDRNGTPSDRLQKTINQTQEYFNLVGVKDDVFIRPEKDEIQTCVRSPPAPEGQGHPVDRPHKSNASRPKLSWANSPPALEGQGHPVVPAHCWHHFVCSRCSILASDSSYCHLSDVWRAACVFSWRLLPTRVRLRRASSASCGR